VYCVYLLAAGGRMAYAGFSGRMEEVVQTLQGLSSAVNRGLRPDAAYVMACTRSRSLAPAWEAWLHKAYRPPYAARPPPRGRESLPTRHPGGTSHKPRSTSRSARRLADMNPRQPAAEAQAQSQDVRRGERRRPARAERCRSRRLRTHSSASRLCPTAWAYDSLVQTCRYFLTGVVRPVSLYLWGRTCAGGVTDCEGGEVVTVHHAQWHLPQTWIERLKNAWSSR